MPTKTLVHIRHNAEAGMNFDSIRDIVIFALAIYGAGLSTLNWLAVRKKDKHSVQVEFNTVTPVYGSELGEPFVHLSVTNTGFRDITISSIFLSLPGGKSLFSLKSNNFVEPDSRLPVKLHPGDIASAYMAYSDVAHSMQSNGFKGAAKVRPACKDSLGRRHLGEPLMVEPREFLKVSGR